MAAKKTTKKMPPAFTKQSAKVAGSNTKGAKSPVVKGASYKGGMKQGAGKKK
jgi:hypothetical protein